MTLLHDSAMASVVVVSTAGGEIDVSDSVEVSSTPAVNISRAPPARFKARNGVTGGVDSLSTSPYKGGVDETGNMPNAKEKLFE